MTRDRAVQRAYLALLLAILDGECEQRLHDLLCTVDDPHLALEVAHHAAHRMVDSIDPGDHAEMHADIAAELLGLAGANDDEA